MEIRRLFGRVDQARGDEDVCGRSEVELSGLASAADPDAVGRLADRDHLARHGTDAP